MLYFYRFAIVGAAGFLVDACIFYTLITLFSISYNEARIFAFLMATLTTWLGSRFVSFIHINRSDAIQQLLKHCSCAGFSFIFNYTTFQLLLFLRAPLAIAFIAGFFAGMLSNYVISRRLAFISIPS